MVGGGRNNKERVKLLFIQNEQNLEKGKNKGGGKGEEKEKAEQYSCKLEPYFAKVSEELSKNIEV